MMRLFLNQPKTCFFVDAMCRSKNALRPENNLPIACGAGEADAFVHERVSQAKATGARLNKEETKASPSSVRLDA